MLTAPLIVRAPEDLTADLQEVVMFLHDFSFKTPEEVLEEIAGAGDHSAEGNAAGGMAGMNNGSMAMGNMQGMGNGAMRGMQMGDQMGMGNMLGMGGMQMDLNDFNWDACLINDRTLSDPEVMLVERGGRIRLRVFHASAASVFWIDTGASATYDVI